MRPAPSPLADVEFRLNSSTPAAAAAVGAPSSPATCGAQNCPWWPSSSSHDLEVSSALVFVVLLFAILCALGFNVVLCYFIRPLCMRWRRPQISPPENPRAQFGETDDTPVSIYSEETKLAGEEAVCAICLSEFEVGERIRVVEKCGHGFHVQCIQRWLFSHSSCPTCRANC